MRRWRMSTLDLWLSPSSRVALASPSLDSAFSRSSSSTERRCCRLAISCSLDRLSCSSSLFRCSAASARSSAWSASTRSEFSFSLIRSCTPRQYLCTLAADAQTHHGRLWWSWCSIGRLCLGPRRPCWCPAPITRVAHVTCPPRAPRRCELGKWRHTRPSPQRTMACEHRVELYVYDLTQGLARQLSPALLGQQIDGVWHSAIVAWGREIFFGHGISIVAPPGTTHVRGALGGAAADRVAR